MELELFKKKGLKILLGILSLIFMYSTDKGFHRPAIFQRYY